MIIDNKKNVTVLVTEETVKINSDNSKLLYPEVSSQNGYVGTTKELKDCVKFIPVGKEIKLGHIKRNIDSDEIFYAVEFNYMDKNHVRDIKREMLNKSKILELSTYGADVFEHNSTIVVKHLLNQEQTAPVKNVHSDIGWGEFNGEDIFKYSMALGIDSQYIGDLKIEPHGTIDGWTEVFRNHVLGHIPLEAASVFGISSIVLGYISKDIGIDCLIIHIYGDSTQGKTTACQLAISTAGYPDTKENGLMTTWNATLNATMGTLRGNKGLPMLLDEASMSDVKDFSNVIYTLAAGKEKARMNKELEIRKSATWCTTILSNGEHSMSVKSNQNTGIKVRVSEYGGITWTQSATNADAIKEGILANYGHVAPLIAAKILELGKPKLIERWRRWKEECLDSMETKDNFAPRIAAKLGIIMTAAEILEETLSLGLNIQGIKEFILENEKSSYVQRDIYKNAYDYFQEQVGIHRNNFSSEYHGIPGTNEPAKLEHWGKIDHSKGLKKEKCSTTITITISSFNNILQQGGFQDPKIILKQWKSTGILDCEKDRYTRKRKISSIGSAIDVYVIKIKHEEDEFELSQETKPLNKLGRKVIPKKQGRQAGTIGLDQHSQDLEL